MKLISKKADTTKKSFVALNDQQLSQVVGGTGWQDPRSFPTRD